MNEEKKNKIDIIKKKYKELLMEQEILKLRYSREIDLIKKFSCIGIIKNFLPIFDSLEITYRNCKEPAIKEGIFMTIRIFKIILKKNNILIINPKKFEKFNPNYHQAILKIKTATKPNLVFNILQKGFRILNKIIRPALVGVTVT